MKKITRLIIFFLLLFIVPFSVNALSKDYEDKVYSIVNKEVVEEKLIFISFMVMDVRIVEMLKDFLMI